MIYLCRHGQCKFNILRELRSISPNGLTSLGVKQSHALARFLQHRQVGSVISSPERRAIETASIISQRIKVIHDIDDNLRERNYGNFEGMNLETLKSLRTSMGHRYIDVALDWENVNGVESTAEVYERVRSLLHSISETETVALVTHAGVIFSLLTQLFNFGNNRMATIRIANGGFVKIEKRLSSFTLHELGYPELDSYLV